MRNLLAIAVALVPACTLLVPTDELAGSPPSTPPDDGQPTRDASQPTQDASAGADAPASPYEALILADGPLAYWRMGISSGRIVPDRTGRGNDLVLQGTGHELGVPGAIVGDGDGAIEFDGVSSRAIATNARAFDFEGRHPFSIECWFLRRPRTNAPEYQYIVNSSIGDGASRTGYALWIAPPEGGNSDPHGGFEWMTSGGDIQVNGALPPADEFVHYVAVFDGTKALLYTDGVSDFTSLTGPGEQTARVTDFVIGGDYDGSECVSGVIDEVAIYDRALSPAEVARHLSAGRGL